MQKRHFLGGLFLTKCRKKCQNGISYEKYEHSQNWENCKKCRFGISYDLVHKKLKKLLKVCKYFFFNLPNYFIGILNILARPKKEIFSLLFY